MNEWIRSEDQLPLPGQKVIVTDGELEWFILVYKGLSHYNTPNNWFYDWTMSNSLNVKYWMPKEGALPPLPPDAP